MSILKFGSIGPEVSTLQNNYNKIGISKLILNKDLDADGDFGAQTLLVTHAFQKAHGLVDDGIVGSQTQHVIVSVLGGAVPIPTGFVYGIDLYHGDSITDVNRLASSNFQFIIHKVIEGNNYIDKSFVSRRKSLLDLGKIFGAYMFIHPGESAKSQVDFLMRAMGNLGEYELPVSIDWETDDGMSNSHMNDVVAEMVQLLKSSTGKNPIIYSSYGQLAGYGVRPALSAQPLWVADLRAGTAPRIPDPWSDYLFWQYSFTANVPGIGNPCDVNKFKGDLNTLKKFIADSKV